ncbi:hypothetical protein HK102_004941 [Quaeritorhiza haematococci]|nr:hypothetical protein HK102_004941 [Quaeritorhiza haematococci]
MNKLAIIRLNISPSSLPTLTTFYTKTLSFTHLRAFETPTEHIHWFGLPTQSPSSALIEFRCLKNPPQNTTNTTYTPTRSDVYWKIGLSLRDVSLASQRLSTQHDVSVGTPHQFLDIGFLTHLRDPSNHTIELLQHSFAQNHIPVPPSEIDPSHPLGQPTSIGQITLRCLDAGRSVQFWGDVLGMRWLSIQPVEPYNFTLHFLAYTEEEPPNNVDLKDVANREWLWKKGYTQIELQEIHGTTQPYKLPKVEEGELGFGGVGVFVPKGKIQVFYEGVRGKWKVEKELGVSDVYGVQCFEVRDPDGGVVTIMEEVEV